MSFKRQEGISEVVIEINIKNDSPMLFLEVTNKTPQILGKLGSFNECSTYLIPFFDSQYISHLWYNMVSDKRAHGTTLSLDEFAASDF